ncbi:hypothetical protein AAHA92_20586 [Salvia divinorum]|uniref:Uncharacterized protein n=1 Tax=Salvia divinorum TaxID=28513 RepID=A0ABD1GHP0_SALDI
MPLMYFRYTKRQRRSTALSLSPANFSLRRFSSSIQSIAAQLLQKKEAMGSDACADEQQAISGNWSLICKTGDEEAGPATPEEKAEHSPTHSSPDVETPKETLFDSFAPGSDKLLLAPRRLKYRDESCSHVVRRLDFASSLIEEFDNVADDDDEADDEEQRLFEIVHGTIMDAISEEQGALRSTPLLAGIAETRPEEQGTPSSTPILTGIAETCPEEQGTPRSTPLLTGIAETCPEEQGTPRSTPLLTGIAETCPAAPIKSATTRQRCIIDKDICRKLF